VNNTILFGKTPLKAQNDYFLKIWGGMHTLSPLATRMFRAQFDLIAYKTPCCIKLIVKDTRRANDRRGCLDLR